MPYLHFIWKKFVSKGGQIQGLDVTFQMHIIDKIFNIIKYLKNEKNQKLKTKKEKENRENGLKRPKMAKRPNFFSGASSSKQNEKNEHC